MRSPELHFVIPIHSVLSSAISIRLGPPGAPSLIEIGPPAEIVLLPPGARLSTVKFPLNKPSDCSFWPTTYIVEVDTSALLEPPGIANVHELAFGVVAQSA